MDNCELLDLIRDGEIACPKCGGSGAEELPIPVHRPGQPAKVIERTCGRCKGTGKVKCESNVSP